ncbi:amidohydrolase family protein [Tautonia rosea]|uniref:amidohydrolase family protein n=1 Tax=Tautonia rosea TaxID=2728037 RepID=UPI00147660CB|nr:amidohydrolase family protein [Tautonia rosea]
MPTDNHAPPQISRRTLLQYSAIASVGASPLAPRLAVAYEPSKHADIVIDCHAHLHHHSQNEWEQRDRNLIEVADRLGIDQLCCSILTPQRPATPEGFRQCNAWVADAIDRFPNRILGYCYVNPGHQAEALDEIRRCVEDRGLIGVKLYNEHRCTDPIVFPIIELAIELRVPILHHAGHMHFVPPEQPLISDGGHLAELSQRYPEAMLICAHVCGGGDWEWTIKALRHAPSVMLDLSGSVIDDGVVEMAVEVLGVDRLLFGCDMSMTAGIGRIRAAELDEEAKARILGKNMQTLLQRRAT